MSLLKRVGMNWYEQIGIDAIGYIGALVKTDENILFAGANNFYIGMGFGNVSFHQQTDSQVNILLFAFSANRARIAPAMPGVEHECKLPACLRCNV